MDKWKSTSIDSQKYENEQLQAQLEALKEDHATALKNKAQEFERWIGQKEKAIEVECRKRFVIFRPSSVKSVFLNIFLFQG